MKGGRVLSHVPVSRNCYKTVYLYENVYKFFFTKIVGLNISYSANKQPIYKNDIPEKPEKLRFPLKLSFEFDNCSFFI